jgi:hypothetical protein
MEREDHYTMDDEFSDESNVLPARAPRGRFAKGNQEGRKFQKGYPGKPKGSRNRKTLLAKEFAEDVLYLNPKTGKEMTYHELCMYVKKRADSSPRILNLLLDHALSKPAETTQETVTFILSSRPHEEKAIGAQKVTIDVPDRFELPALSEKSEDEEGQEPV